MSPADNVGNPVIRLSKILVAAAAVPSSQPNGGRALTVREAWCQVFSIVPTGGDVGTPEVIMAVLALRQLFEEAILALSAVDGINADMYVVPLHEMSQVAGSLAELEQQWSGSLRHIAGDRQLVLRYIVEFSKSIPAKVEDEIPADEIKEILTTADELYESIVNSSLPQGTKKILLDIVQRLRDAIHLYRVHGAKSLKKAMGDSFGILFTNKEVIDENKDSEQLKAVASLMMKVDTAYQIATKAKGFLELATTMMPLLGAGK